MKPPQRRSIHACFDRESARTPCSRLSQCEAPASATTCLTSPVRGTPDAPLPRSAWRSSACAALLDVFLDSGAAPTTTARARQGPVRQVRDRDSAVTEATEELDDALDVVELQVRELHDVLRRVAELGLGELPLGVPELPRDRAELIQELPVQALELAAARLGVPRAGHHLLALPGALQLDQPRQIAVFVGSRHLLHHLRPALPLVLAGGLIRVGGAPPTRENVRE